MTLRLLFSDHVETMTMTTTMSRSKANAISLEAEIEWFTKVMETRLKLIFWSGLCTDGHP